MITPTNGRIVWFTQASHQLLVQHDRRKPLAAMIVHVWNDRLVNLVVYDSNGFPNPVTSVPLHQGDDLDHPWPGKMFCEWMPYQLGQAAKTEQAEAAACAASNSVGRGS